MALELIATAGASNANSYATIAEANAYHEAHIAADDWLAADSETHLEQIRALVMATRILDEQMDWLGDKATPEQALRWPRTGVYDRDGNELDGTTIPLDVMRATAELARHLLKKDRFQAIDDAASGISEVQAGSVRVKFDAATKMALIPPSVDSLVGPYSAGGAGDDLSVPLVRV